MVVEVTGKIYRVGKTAKGDYAVAILVPRKDGQADSLTIYTARDGWKPGQEFKGKVDVFVRTAREEV